MNPEQLEQQEMEKLAGAASLVKELAEAHGIDVDNLTEEEAQDLIGQAYQALHGLEDQPAGEEKTASVIIKEFSETEEGMAKLAAAGQIGEELLEQEGLSPSDLTEEQAAEVLLHVLNNYEFEEEEKTASVIVEELSQNEEYMAKLAAAGEIAHEVLEQEGLKPDDLTEDQAAELLLNILVGQQEHEEKTAAVQEDLQQIAALREAGAVMYSGFADAMEKEAGVSMAGLKEAIMKALGAAKAKGKAAGKWMLSPKYKGGAGGIKSAFRKGPPNAPLSTKERASLMGREALRQLSRPVVPAGAALAGGGGAAALLAGKKKK